MKLGSAINYHAFSALVIITGSRAMYDSFSNLTDKAEDLQERGMTEEESTEPFVHGVDALPTELTVAPMCF